MQTVSFDRGNQFVCPIIFLIGIHLSQFLPTAALFPLEEEEGGGGGHTIYLTLLLSLLYSIFWVFFIPGCRLE